MTEEGKDTFKCEYVAPVEGAYKVDVKFDGSPVPGSPFPVEVAKPGDAGKCRAQGDGLETAIIDQLAEFDVDCKSAGKRADFQGFSFVNRPNSYARCCTGTGLPLRLIRGIFSNANEINDIRAWVSFSSSPIPTI